MIQTKRFAIFILVTAIAVTVPTTAAFAGFITTNPESETVTSRGAYKTTGISAKTFSDVTYKNWFYKNVMQAAELGFVKGYDDGTYHPNGSVTRAEICQILYNYKGEDATAITNFSDVKPENWFYTSVSWAVSQGLISGRSDGSFGPNEDLTRERLVYSLYELAGAPETDVTVLEAFSDSSEITEICLNAFAWAVSNGIVNGVTETTLEPTSTTTRAQVATVMIRYAEIINGDEIPEIDVETQEGTSA